MTDHACGNVRDTLNESASMPRNVEMEATGGTNLPGSVGESGFPDLSDPREILKEVGIDQTGRKQRPQAISPRPDNKGLLLPCQCWSCRTYRLFTDDL